MTKPLHEQQPATVKGENATKALLAFYRLLGWCRNYDTNLVNLLNKQQEVQKLEEELAHKRLELSAIQDGCNASRLEAKEELKALMDLGLTKEQVYDRIPGMSLRGLDKLDEKALLQKGFHVTTDAKG